MIKARKGKGKFTGALCPDGRTSTAVIRERGKVGFAAAKGEWPNLTRRRGHTDNGLCCSSVRSTKTQSGLLFPAVD